MGYNEIEMAKYLNSLDQDKIDSLAFVYTEGYRKGFINTGKDLSIKETVDIRYNIAFSYTHLDVYKRQVIALRDILLAKETGAKLHLCHCSTKDSVKMVRRAKEEGVKVTAEVCPHHFSMCSDDTVSYTHLDVYKRQISGCAHCGIINILEAYKKKFANEPMVVLSLIHIYLQQYLVRFLTMWNLEK